jgi:hypothetical protein
LAPAVAAYFTFSGATLSYTGTAASNVVQISGSAGSLTITDLTGTITSTVPGFTGNGTNTVTGAIPSAATLISITGGSGADSVTFAAGFSTTRNVTVNALSIVTSGAATTDNFTATGTSIRLGGNLSTTAGVIAGNATFNGTVTTTAPVTITTASTTNGNVTFNGAVSSANPLTINAGNTGVVTETGTTSMTIAGNDFTISNAGSITLGPTTVNGNISLTAQGGIKLQSTLTDTNAADDITISANQAGAGASGFNQTAGTITTAGPLVSITVGGTAAADIQSITTGAGGTVIISAGGGIPDFNGSAVNINTGIDGTAILTAGYAGISLDTEVGFLQATVLGQASPNTSPISIRNSGQPLTINSATTSYGSVTITNNDDVTVAGPITAAGPAQYVTLTTTAGTGAGDVVIQVFTTITSLGGTPTGSTSFLPGKVTITTPGSISSAGGSSAVVSSPSVFLYAGTGISGTTGPLDASMPIDTDTVSATTNTGGIGLATETPGRALTVTKATANTGAVTITTLAGSLGSNDLSITGLVTGSSVLLQAGDSLNVAAFATVASSGTLTLDAEQNLSVQQGAKVAATGNILFNDGMGTFPLGVNPSVISIAGSVTTAGTATINGSINNDVISVTGTISATGGLSVDVGAGANILILAPSTVTAYTINLPAGFHEGDTIIIDAPAADVATASATGVTFTVASGFQSWTINNFSSADGDTIPPYV